MTTPQITQAELKERLTYDPETGTFAWRTQQRGTVRLDSVNGCPVGTLSNGRIVVGLNGKVYTTARLAWLYMYGALPVGNLRHVDGNPLNVAISNLQLANGNALPRKPRTKPENRAHTPYICKADGSYHVRGVTLDKRRGKWAARPTIRGKRTLLGYFATEQEAEKAVVKAFKSGADSHA